MTVAANRHNSTVHAPTADTLPYRMVVLLWILYLFSPHKLLQFFVPAAQPITWILEILLLANAAIYLITSTNRRGYPAFTVMLALTVLGLFMAGMFGEWGRVRGVIRTLYQPYVLALLTFAYCATRERAATIFKIYFLHLVYFGLWGLFSLVYTPFNPDIDPGARDIVFWHISYDNRDAFGPLMAIGFTFSAYYFRALGNTSKLPIANMLISLAGVVTSFGRGVFLSLLVGCALMWARARHKGRVLVLIAGVCLIGAAAAPSLIERYVVSMGTIVSEGAEKGTGADRKILWTWAARVFMLNPIAGVGPSNFGIAVFDVVTLSEAAQYNYTRGTLWGRALHSTPMTVLSEYGTLGVLAMIFLIFDFFRTNRAIRTTTFGATPAAHAQQADAKLGRNYIDNIALGLQTAFVTFCVNSIFYEIFYISMLWHLITLNRLLYYVSNVHLRTTPVTNKSPRENLQVGLHELPPQRPEMRGLYH